MTCYFRHQAGIEVTHENRREIDRIIYSIISVGYKNCPVPWRENVL